MQTKLHINISQGLVEVEGEQDFVEKIHKEYHEILKAKLSQSRVASTVPNQGASSAKVATEKAAKPKTGVTKKTGGGKKSGPSCADRILILKSEDFFGSLRTAKEIRSALGTKGFHYKANQIAASLTSLTKRTELRRIDEDGWKYTNP